MKQYEFNGKTFDALEPLMQEYIENYKLATDDVIVNYKKLLAFVRKLAKKTKEEDKEAKIKEYYTYSKSKNSVLTFIIFELLEEKAVYINGVKLSFEDFTKNLKTVDLSKRNVLVDFLKDGGIENTYSRMPEYEFLKTDAKFLDSTGDTEETINYLINYYGEKSDSFAENLNIILNEDTKEKFRKFNRLLKNKEFIDYLSHKYGFTNISKSFNDSSKVFEVTRALSKEKDIPLNKLLVIFDDAYFLWLPENYTKYTYKKKEAKALKKELKASKKLLAKTLKKYQNNLGERISKKSELTHFDMIIDCYAKLNNDYLLFCKLYYSNMIIAKNSDYNLDYNYANVLICQNYANGKELTLANETPNPVELDDTSLDFSDFSNVKNSKFEQDRILKARKIQNKNNTLALFSGITTTILTMLTIASAIYLLFVKDLAFMADFLSKNEYEFNDVRTFITIPGGLLGLGIGLSIALSTRSSRTEGHLSNLLFLKKAEENLNILTVMQKEKYTNLKNKEYQLEANMRNGHSLISSATIFVHSLSVAIFALFVMYILSYFKNFPMEINSAETLMPILLSLFVGPIITTVLLFFKKPKNNWLLLLLDLVTIGIVFAANQYLTTH